jgi:hypothetical protein
MVARKDYKRLHFLCHLHEVERLTRPLDTVVDGLGSVDGRAQGLQKAVFLVPSTRSGKLTRPCHWGQINIYI